MNGISYFDTAIEKKLLSVRTSYIAKVLSVNGAAALVQPLTLSRAIGGSAAKPSPVSAVVPSYIKVKEKEITYKVSETESETTTVLVPSELAAGDIVCVGVCDRDITNAKSGILSEATARHHDINDSVILRVL